MNLTSTIIFASAIIAGFIIAAAIISANRGAMKKEVLADLITEIAKDESAYNSTTQLEYQSASVHEVFNLAWDIFDKNPRTTDFVEVQTSEGGCQIIPDRNSAVCRIMSLYSIDCGKTPIELQGLEEGDGLYCSYHPYPTGKEDIQKEVLSILKKSKDDMVEYKLWQKEENI